MSKQTLKKRELIRRWRRVRPAKSRLYWRNGRNEWKFRDYFDRGVIAIIRQGALTIKFYSLVALEEEIEYLESMKP